MDYFIINKSYSVWCYNAGLPASVAVERLFNEAGLIYIPKRSNLNDAKFGMLLFLKCNNSVKIKNENVVFFLWNIVYYALFKMKIIKTINLEIGMVKNLKFSI